jgi:hypothetical protein
MIGEKEYVNYSKDSQKLSKFKLTMTPKTITNSTSDVKKQSNLQIEQKDLVKAIGE